MENKKKLKKKNEGKYPKIFVVEFFFTVKISRGDKTRYNIFIPSKKTNLYGLGLKKYPSNREFNE